MEDFQGYHSEWNLGSPGGWDYQRLTQTIGKTVWQKLNLIHHFDLDLDFDNPLFSPIDGLADILVDSHRSREGRAPGLIAVVAEEELEIARLNPWGGSAAIIASDGLFDFGAAKAE